MKKKMINKKDIIESMRNNAFNIDKCIDESISMTNNQIGLCKNKELVAKVNENTAKTFGNHIQNSFDTIGAVTDVINTAAECVNAQMADIENITLSNEVLIDSAKFQLSQYKDDFDLDSVADLKNLWTSIQAKIILMNSDMLNHVISLASVEKLLRLKDKEEYDNI